MKEFMEHCNNYHPTIKFTFNYDLNTRSVDFLDIHIWIDTNGYIQTDLYQKPGKVCQAATSTKQRSSIAHLP